MGSRSKETMLRRSLSLALAPLKSLLLLLPLRCCSPRLEQSYGILVDRTSRAAREVKERAQGEAQALRDRRSFDRSPKEGSSLGVEGEWKGKRERKTLRCVVATLSICAPLPLSLPCLFASAAPHAPTNRRCLRSRARGSQRGSIHGSVGRSSSSSRCSGGGLLFDGEESGGSGGDFGAGEEGILLVRCRPPREGLGHAQGLVVFLGGLHRRPEDGPGQDHDAGPRKGEGDGKKGRKKGSMAREREKGKKKNLDDDERGRALSSPHSLSLSTSSSLSSSNLQHLQQVDVDFFGPIILTAKREAVRAWRKLPPPAQKAAPYLATAAGSGGSTYAWQRRRFIHERARGDLLASRVESLSAERVKLQDACKALRAAAATPRAAADVRSAEAVAAATGAAAAAAVAAAEAAKACAVYVTRGGGGYAPSRRTPEN